MRELKSTFDQGRERVSAEMKDCTQILHILRWSEVRLAEVHGNAQSEEEVQDVVQHCSKALW